MGILLFVQPLTANSKPCNSKLKTDVFAQSTDFFALFFYHFARLRHFGSCKTHCFTK